MTPGRFWTHARGLSFVLAAVALALTSTRPARADVRACIEQHSEGQLLRDQSQFLEARSRFVSCADPACPDAIRAECANLLTELERALPTVVLAARDTQHGDVPGVRVELDGQALEEALNGRAIAMNPGAHSLRFIAPDGRTKVIDVVALEWVKGRPVEATFDTPVPAAPALVQPPPQQQPGQNASVPSVAPSSSRRTLAYVLGGVGIAALAGSGYFAWSGRSRRQDLAETCAPGCTEEQVSSVRSKYLIADILLGVGVASLGTGAYFFSHAVRHGGAGSAGAGTRSGHERRFLMPTKRVAQWGEDVKTAVEVPTNRSQQRLKTSVKAAGGWDEDVHTVARPADAILPAAAFREGQAALPAPQRAPARAVTPPPLPPAAAAPSTPPPPLAEPEAASPSYELKAASPSYELKAASPSYAEQLDDSVADYETPPGTRARLRPGHWALVCLTAALFGVLGYAGVSVGQVLSQRAALRAGAALEPAAAASDSGWVRAVADRIEPLL